MTKVELIKAVAEKTGFTQKDVKAVQETMQEVVFESLKAGDKVKVMDGITFESKHVESRERRNPATGTTFMADPCEKPVCKFGTAIKDYLNA